MSDLMTFPDSVEEFMNQYKVVDTEQVYTNGAELVPIFRMKQWFEHLPSAQRKGKWYAIGNTGLATCECGYITDRHSVYNYCPKCGALMKGEDDEYL